MRDPRSSATLTPVVRRRPSLGDLIRPVASRRSVTAVFVTPRRASNRSRVGSAGLGAPFERTRDSVLVAPRPAGLEVGPRPRVVVEAHLPHRPRLHWSYGRMPPLHELRVCARLTLVAGIDHRLTEAVNLEIRGGTRRERGDRDVDRLRHPGAAHPRSRNSHTVSGQLRRFFCLLHLLKEVVHLRIRSNSSQTHVTQPDVLGDGRRHERPRRGGTSHRREERTRGSVSLTHGVYARASVEHRLLDALHVPADRGLARRVEARGGERLRNLLSPFAPAIPPRAPLYANTELSFSGSSAHVLPSPVYVPGASATNASDPATTSGRFAVMPLATAFADLSGAGSSPTPAPWPRSVYRCAAQDRSRRRGRGRRCRGASR